MYVYVHMCILPRGTCGLGTKGLWGFLFHLVEMLGIPSPGAQGCSVRSPWVAGVPLAISKGVPPS